MNLKELYDSGKSLREIADLVSLDYTTVYRKLVCDGVNIRQQNKNLQQFAGEILYLSQQGYSNRYIAEKFNVTHPTIAKILRGATQYHDEDILQWIRKYYKFERERNGLYCKEKDYYIYYLLFKNIPCKYYCRDLAAQSKNIIIFEDEWLLRCDQVKDFVLAKLGIYEERIFARKCDIRNIDKKIATDFISHNHIQKTNNPGVTNIGLYYQDKLVGLCQLRKHHRNSSDITISRMCFARGIQVTGGFSRLVKHAVAWCRNNGYKKLTTWSDNRITNGHSYIQAGFIHAGELKPDYSYIHPDKPGQRFSKQSMKKSNIHCPEGFTEREWTEKLGYQRIWDCGKTKFVYNII